MSYKFSLFGEHLQIAGEVGAFTGGNWHLLRNVRIRQLQ